ncbi:hypothetical protein PR048_027286 [Dryococelus australis]|uniref:Uncharacterized protein n=1 Tax=Dryococelus australis TaxID=614101 RepID=A0ABQ9GF14_9NEOP|nr:hypothetical protein PR048_027286 [Dryococelus australis]
MKKLIPKVAKETTIPTINSYIEHSFSLMKRIIHTYIRNSQKQDRLTNIRLH